MLVRGGGGGEEGSDVPLPGLPLFLVFFWQRVHPVCSPWESWSLWDPGALGTLWQRAGEVAGWLCWCECCSPSSGMLWGGSRAVGLLVLGQAELLLLLGSPVWMQRDEWIH